MTNISSTQNVSTLQTATIIEEESLKDSIAKVINALTDSAKEGGSLKNERVSEDILYAAIVHSKLAQKNKALASSYLTSLPKRYARLEKQRSRQPIFEATEKFLKRAVKNHNISGRQKSAICREAFGKAQLDDKQSKLKRHVVELTTPEQSPPSNIELTLSKVNGNDTATKTEYRKFRKFIENHNPLTKAQVNARKDILSEIDPETPPTSSPSETDRAADLPSSINIRTEPWELTYKPISEKGGALVMIPVAYAEDVDEVVLMNNSSEEKIPLTFTGKGDDGRTYFRWDQPGNSLHGQYDIRIHFTDGEYRSFRIDPQEFFKKAISLRL